MFKEGDHYIHFTKYGGVNKGKVEWFGTQINWDTENMVAYHIPYIKTTKGIIIHLNGDDGRVYKIKNDITEEMLNRLKSSSTIFEEIQDRKRRLKNERIFLDHDGVICLSTEWGGRFKKQRNAGRKLSQSIESLPVLARFDNFNKKAVEVLNEILETTNAEIVVSSDWKRWATVEEMGEYYESQGIKKKPIAFTKNLGECDVPENFVWSRQWDLEQSRSLEIKQYLKDIPEITHWVAVDDLNMGIPQKHETWGDMEMDWGLTNFVLTPKGSEGIKQSGIKDKILNFLL